MIAIARQLRVDRLDLGLVLQRRRERIGEPLAARVGQQFRHRHAVERTRRAGPAEDAPERRVGADDTAILVERRDGERRLVEEAREADLGRTQRFLALDAAAAVEHKRPRLAQLTIGEPRGAMQQANRDRCAVVA